MVLRLLTPVFLRCPGIIIIIIIIIIIVADPKVLFRSRNFCSPIPLV
jgi:hypothetical protein